MKNIVSTVKNFFIKQSDNSDERYWQPNNQFFSTLNAVMNNGSLANVRVTPEDSLSIAAYWCAARAISEDIAKLPVSMFRRVSNGERKFISSDPVLSLLTDGFNNDLDAMTGKQTIVFWLLVYGNAYAEITRNASGRIQLHLIHPSRVKVNRNNQTQLLEYDIVTTSEVDKRRNEIITLPQTRVLHLVGAVGNGVVGYSLAQVAAESLGISSAAQNFTGSFFGQNLNVGTILQTPKKLDPDIKDEVRKEWKNQFGGSANNGALAILHDEWKYEKIQMTSSDAELLKTREHQIIEIARWFRMPPHKLMHLMGAKFNNVEQQNIEYVTDCLGAWIVRLETQFKFKFFRGQNKFIDIDEKFLTRGDIATRTAYYDKLFLMGAISPKTIATLEGFPTEGVSELYYQPLNMQSTQLAEEHQFLQNKSIELDNQSKEKSLQDPEPEIDPEDDAVSEGSLEEETTEIEEQEQGNLISAEVVLGSYRQTVKSSMDICVSKEYNAHKIAKRKSGNELAEHLNKFYSKYESQLASTIKGHMDFICTVSQKQLFSDNKLTEATKAICNMSKDYGWESTRSDEIVQYIFELCGQACDVINLGDIVQGEDGRHYIMTIDGLRPANVTV